MFELRSDNSLIVSIELNSVLYQGVLYPRGVPGHPLHGLTTRGLSASQQAVYIKLTDICIRGCSALEVCQYICHLSPVIFVHHHQHDEVEDIRARGCSGLLVWQDISYMDSSPHLQSSTLLCTLSASLNRDCIRGVYPSCTMYHKQHTEQNRNYVLVSASAPLNIQMCGVI